MSGQILQEVSMKKIKGAVSKVYEGVHFDSQLEISCYKLLKEANIPFRYNDTTLTLLPSFRLKEVNFYHSIPKNKGYGMIKNSKGEKEVMLSIKYTPDFIIEVDNYLIYIETKGFANDVYPYKRKLLFKQLEEYTDKYKGIYFFEPKTVKHIKESLGIIKKIIDGESRQDKGIIIPDINELK